MITQDITTIIPQLPGEPDTSYQRLIIKHKKGFTTLEELSNYLEQENHRLKVSQGTIENNSSQYKYTQRRQTYQEHIDKQLQEEMQQLYKDLNNHSIHDMQEFIQELQNTFHEIINRHKNNGEYQPSYLLKMFKDYIYCYRQATEIYYINSRHKLEPEHEEEDTITIDEIMVNDDILDEEHMQERNTVLKKLIGDKKT